MNDNEIFSKISKDKNFRKVLAIRSHYWFFHIYFPHYIKYKTASFQKEMIEITEDNAIRNAVIVAFRGSAKSTVMTLSYAIWAMVAGRKRFITILSQTQQQSKLILTNIKHELEFNELLISDFGPFGEDAEEWRANSLVLTKYDTRITALSTGESIRGLRHKEIRPDLIVCDDVEDLSSVRNKEGRDKTFNWLTSEVIPAGDINTKLIVIGNLLHEDSLMVRLKKLIGEKKMDGIYREYPLIDSSGNVLWPGKYPSQESIEAQRRNTASESAWQREYLLKIISDKDRVVRQEWIHYYDNLPDLDGEDYLYTATGIDLAISKNDSADLTAMVSAHVFGYIENLRVYIIPDLVNERIDFPETVAMAKNLSKSLGGGDYTKLFIEEVGYQGSLIQDLVNKNVPAEGVKVRGQDKRARLALITHLIKQGKILFPRRGVEELIVQLTGFGIEKHDDLADAFSILVHGILREDEDGEPEMIIVDM